MASITSLMGGSSSSSSIYGTKNVLSGLASGLDTESLIENAISGYKNKITNLQKDRTKVGWKQDAYRDIIHKLANFSEKYTSYTSGTNLLSSTFFNTSVNVTAQGKHADMVSVSGKSSSDIKINSVKSLATSTRYSTGGLQTLTDNMARTGTFSLGDKVPSGQLSGSLVFTYDTNTKIKIRFDESEVFETAEDLAKAINEKLKDKVINFSNGTQVAASERIKAEVDENDQIVIKGDTDEHTKQISISQNDSDSSLVEALWGQGNTPSLSINFPVVKNNLVTQTDILSYLSEKGFTVTVNGDTKKISDFGTSFSNESDLINAINAKLKEAFGEISSGTNKIEVEDLITGNGIQLKFSSQDKNTTFKVETDTALAKKLGIEGGLANYVNTSRKLSDLTGGLKNTWRVMAADPQKLSTPDANGIRTDENGVRYKQDNSQWYQVDDAGDFVYGIEVNGDVIATVGKDSTVQDLMDAINKSDKSTIKAAYSSFTKEFSFTAKNAGQGSDFTFKANSMMADLFGKVDPTDQNLTGYTKGTDAEFTVTVNGNTQTRTYSGNTIDIDGLKITLNGAFNENGNDPGDITFKTETDTDKIVNAIKDMVNDFNAVMKDIKTAYSTVPLQKSNGSYYEPLSEEDAADMTESAVKAYEEKAKTGLLFGDRDLSNLYSNLRNALNSLGVTGNDAAKIGITTSFSSSGTTIVVDEKALREALNENPDKVKEAFTSGKNGRGSMMEQISQTIKQYAGTTGATKGILVQKAGTPLSPLSVYQNTIQTQLDDIDKKIEKMQDKISDQIDYYTTRFTALEKMIAQMNNQSGMLMGMSGGY